MLRGFENITFEITSEEKELLPLIIKGLSNKKGKENAITGAKICQSLKLNPVRLRKIVSYIRTNNLLLGLCSCKKGYFIASNYDELNDCIISLKQRIASQVKVLNSLEQQTIMFGGTGQTSLFE